MTKRIAHRVSQEREDDPRELAPVESVPQHAQGCGEAVSRVEALELRDRGRSGGGELRVHSLAAGAVPKVSRRGMDATRIAGRMEDERIASSYQAALRAVSSDYAAARLVRSE